MQEFEITLETAPEKTELVLIQEQTKLEQIAKQFGILAALFFLLGITFSVGCTSGAKLLYSVFLSIKNKKIRRERNV